MISRMLAVSLAVACSLWACTPALEPAPDLTLPESEESPPAAEERVIAPTPEMLDATLLGDPAEMAAAVAPLSGCPAPSTCPAIYGSCGSWSSYTECSFSCSSDPWCSCGPDIPDQPPCEPNPYDTRGFTIYKSFRVCFKAGGGSCTEWRQAYSNSCGC